MAEVGASTKRRPAAIGKILTILSAMSTRGLIATMTIEEPTDADIFSPMSSRYSARRCDLETSW
jgi:hypothetical protein